MQLAGFGALLIALVFVAEPMNGAAQQTPGSARGGQPGNGLRTVNRTVYTDQTELFITFRPAFIVGQPTRIGAHLSKLGERFLPGHADLSTTQRYMHLSPAATEDAIRLLETRNGRSGSRKSWRHSGGAINESGK